MRIIVEQKNLWGKSGTGVDPQRLDLWQLGLVNVVNGINSFAYEIGDLDPVPAIPAYFAMQVAMPELRIRPDTYRRDSRPYQMPAWDDPLDAIRVVFLLDAGAATRASVIYRVLDAWRALVRAGRGSMTNGYTSQNATGAPGRRVLRLNDSYRVDYAFNIPVTLLKGSRPIVNSAQNQERAFANVQAAKISSGHYLTAQQRANESLKFIAASDLTAANIAQDAAASSQLALSRNSSTSLLNSESTIRNDLEVAGSYLLLNAWLGGLRIGDLNYAQNGLVTLEATLYAEDVVDNVDDTSRGIADDGIQGGFPVGFGQANANVA